MNLQVGFRAYLEVHVRAVAAARNPHPAVEALGSGSREKGERTQTTQKEHHMRRLREKGFRVQGLGV